MSLQVMHDSIIDDAARWHAVEQRDRRADGAFVYAVRSTGVFCRPSCASRRARRENVEFFATPALAEAAGYRACRRCAPHEAEDSQRATVVKLCVLLEQSGDQLTLDDLARASGWSAAHLQRTFKRLVGVSPRQYAASARAQRVKSALRNSPSITTAMYDSGYGSSRGFYEDGASRLGMSPRAYRRSGEALDITYTVAATPLGRALIAATTRGICAVQFADSCADADRELERGLHAEFPRAKIRRDDAGLEAFAAQLAQHLAGSRPQIDLPLHLHGTAFQARVWQALREIPYGQTRSYSQLAAAVGKPNASRAVGSACAANRVAVLVPCHRATRASGELSGYRWGVERKKQLLTTERQRESKPTDARRLFQRPAAH